MKLRTQPLTLSLLAFLFLVSPPAQQVRLTILHTNDTHGHLLPFSYPTDVPPGSELGSLPARTNIGGIARRAGIAKKIRADLEERGDHVWMVDVGDFSDGTPFSTEYGGEADAAAMNAAGYNFGALGNHEFNRSLEDLKSLLRLFRYPILCANAVERSTGKPLAKPSHIQSIRSLKIGILGLLTSDTADYPAARERIAILGETETARNTIKELRKEADIVIVLSHCGERFDRQLARAIPDIDVIIGGHSHSRILKDTIVFHPNKTKAEYINGTIVVQAYQWGGELGRLDLSFSRDTGGVWRIDRYNESFLPITADTPEDPTVAAVVKKYWDPIAPYYGEIIGSAGADFVERGDDLAPYNLFADAIRESLGTEIELENMGGIRAPLIKGDIKRGALIDMDPFDNTIVTFAIGGSRLRKVLQSYRPAVSGIRYRMKKGKLVDVTVGGKPLRDGITYTGSTNSYFARRALRGVRVRDTGRQRLDLLIEYIRKAQTVYPVYDGRRVIVN